VPLFPAVMWIHPALLVATQLHDGFAATLTEPVVAAAVMETLVAESAVPRHWGETTRRFPGAVRAAA